MADNSDVTKVRRCDHAGHCQFKNVYWDNTQCLGKFHIWHTCLYKGQEIKVKKVNKHGENK